MQHALYSFVFRHPLLDKINPVPVPLILDQVSLAMQCHFAVYIVLTARQAIHKA